MTTHKEMLRCLIKNGFTEESIACSLNVNQSTVSRILSGKIKDPRVSIVYGIKELFGIITAGKFSGKRQASSNQSV